MRLGPILRRAADEFLWDGSGVRQWGQGIYSCNAVLRASPTAEKFDRGAADFLEKLGCPTDSFRAFPEFRGGAKRQGARYAWLHFAADIADEWGIEV